MPQIVRSGNRRTRVSCGLSLRLAARQVADVAESPDDVSREITRFAAQRISEILAKQQDAMLAEHSAMARWLTASLLVLNGGGALAVFNAVDRLRFGALDAASFVAGIFAALSVGVLNQRANQSGGKIIGEALGHSFVVAQTGNYTVEAQEAAEAIEMRMTEAGKWPARAGWSSAGFFLLGVLATGADVPPTDKAALNRCAALQQDMLAAHPRRRDGIELFKALGCRPSGEGNVLVPVRR